MSKLFGTNTFGTHMQGCDCSNGSTFWDVNMELLNKRYDDSNKSLEIAPIVILQCNLNKK